MKVREPVSPNDRQQGMLLTLAGFFVLLYAAALTLAPSVRARTWQVDYNWMHWVGAIAWCLTFFIIHRQSIRHLPGRDPYLLPVAALLVGWGLMTIFRLLPEFGLRQTVWLILAGFVMLAGFRLPVDLLYLRQYKYLLLLAGLILTALTIFFGTNPLGSGPRMWLGCCGVYLQPSEPLKLLLVIYLSAYLADQQASIMMLEPGWMGRQTTSRSLLPLLAPTLVMIGIALVLLFAQRDLGTASIFLFLYTVMVYLSTGRKRILLIGGIILLVAGLAGMMFFDLVQVRIEAWLNPWLDPSGRSYQIVQSILAIANGGILGRGPGIGNPGLVPIPHSDFIFAAITEEAGLAGGLALLILIGIFGIRGVISALTAQGQFRRLLAAGLSVFLVGQSLLIIGGNIRVLPLTGVTLPFVSYGGSSLLTSTIALLFLIQISSQKVFKPVPQSISKIYLFLGGLLLAGLLACSLVLGWWSALRGPDLLTRTDNARRVISDRHVRRGSLLDRENRVITESTGIPGSYERQIHYSALSPYVGYTNPSFGQAGLESTLDPYLRGLMGNPNLLVWWNHLLFGEPPPGLDVRLSLDLDLQMQADGLLGEHNGALALLNAETGEILAIASHPTFDANQLETNWEYLTTDPDTPLLDRSVNGHYPVGASISPLIWAQLAANNPNGTNSQDPLSTSGSLTQPCALSLPTSKWETLISAGCPDVLRELMQDLGPAGLKSLILGFGFDDESVNTASGNAGASLDGSSIYASPLQMALAAASLSSSGTYPEPVDVLAVKTPQAGWTPLPSSDPISIYPTEIASQAANQLRVGEPPFWETTAVIQTNRDQPVTWFIGGSLPGSESLPVALALLLEENNPSLAREIGQQLLLKTTTP